MNFGLVHPVTRVVLLLWLVGAFKFTYLAVLLFARLSSPTL